MYKFIIFILFLVIISCSVVTVSEVPIEKSKFIEDDRTIEIESITNISREKFVESVGFGGAGGLGIGIGAPEILVNKDSFIELSKDVNTIYFWEDTRSFWGDSSIAKNAYRYNWSYVRNSGEVITYILEYSAGGRYCFFTHKDGKNLYFKSDTDLKQQGCI